MVDVFNSVKRSKIMARVRGKDTTPEKLVRSLIHRMGYRFRVHRRDLPGNPDIVLPRHRKVVFVHGCFWHQHEGCRRATVPQTNAEFWRKKLASNVQRDADNVTELQRLDWEVLIIWECETRKPDELIRKLDRFLRGE